MVRRGRVIPDGATNSHNPPLHTVGKQGGPNAHVRNTGAIRGCVPYINTSGSLARPTTYEPQFTRNRNTVLEGEPPNPSQAQLTCIHLGSQHPTRCHTATGVMCTRCPYKHTPQVVLHT